MRISNGLFILTALTFSLQAKAYIGGREPNPAINGPVGWRTGLGLMCSATKVSPKHLLTAGHCADQSDAFLKAFRADGRIEVWDSTNIVPRPAKVTKIFVHPGYAPPEHIDEFLDVAVLEVEGLEGVGEIAQINVTPLSVGERILVGGFGDKGPGLPDDLNFTAAFKDIASLDFNSHEISVITEVQDSGDTDLSISGEGDSGGGAYVLNKATQNFEVVAVTSMANYDDGDEQKYFKLNDAGDTLLSVANFAPEAYLAPLANKDKKGSDSVDWLRGLLPAASFTDASTAARP